MSSLDVKIHHRIFVVKIHLLHTHVRLKEKIIENYLINVPIQKDVGNALNIYFIEFCLNRDFHWHENMSSLDVRIHHRICVVQKHLLHTHVRLKEKVIENYLINVPIQKDVGNALNIYFIEFCL